MKILQINSVCGIKSTGRICTDLAEILEEQGHEVKIAYGRDTVPEKYQKYAIKIGTSLDVKIHGIKSRIFDLHGFGSKKATKIFIDWVKKYDPDIIHLHNIHGYYINIKILFDYLRTCNKKIIWTLHDCWAFTGHCSYFSIANCYKWKTQCFKCPQKSQYPKSMIGNNSFKNYKNKKQIFSNIPNLIIVTPSHWLANMVKMSFLKDYPIEVIHNGIDLNVFRPTNSSLKKLHGLEDKKIILGVSSVWDRRKGLKDFIELSKMLDETQKIVLIGLSKEQLGELPNNILGIEHTTDIKELAQWYSTADCFLNPTYEDTYPTVNLEAQACGTPCITYNSCGSPESVVSECVVNQGNIEGIYRLLCQTNLPFYVDSNIFDKKSAFEKYLKLYGLN